MVLLRYSPYGYTPSLAWNATLFTLFALSFIVHLVQATRTRYWILFPTLATGALIELLGYAARIWSATEARQLDAYLMQICLLIMAPVFFSAYCYVVLGTAINRLGPQYSLLPPNFYFILFLTADIVSLILQAVGGGQAATTARTGLPTQRATNIMVAGIIFQLVAMGVFIACGVDFAVRVVRGRPWAFRERRIARAAERAAEVDEEKIQVQAGGMPGTPGEGASVDLREKAPGVGAGAGARAEAGTGVDSDADASAQMGAAGADYAEAGHPGSNASGSPAQLAPELSDKDWKKWWLVMLSVLVSSSMILTRGVFRSVELSEGWTGHLVQTEIYQMVLDGIPMVIAVGVFNLLHPGVLLGRKASWRGYY